jgi:putative tryptophan/tyrosine transport system substrate-binding protein
MEEAPMTRRAMALLITLAVAMLIAPLAADAQPARHVPRVGVLVSAFPPSTPEWKQRSVFWQELRHLGWKEGENLTMEYRWASGERFYRGDELAAELVRLHVDVIVAQGRPLIQAAQHATTTIPIVMISGDDPVAEGFITGLDTSVGAELSTKRLELLQEAVPAVTQIAVLVNPFVPATGQILEDLAEAARALGVQLHVLAVYHPREFEGAFDAATHKEAGALLVLPAQLFSLHQSQLVALTAQHRLPAIFSTRSFVMAGGLLAYGPKASDLEQRAAYYVDRLLKGAKPADLPVERPTTFELVINLKTAQALGLTMPSSLLFQADEVIR